MPGFVKTPHDEAKWAKAKEAAAKQTEHGSESFWKLANHIFHKMDKVEGNQLHTISKSDLQQSIRSNEVENMSDEKKYSAKDAAIAVLKKAEEVLKKHEAMKKSENPFSEKEGKAPEGEIAPKEETQGESVNPGERVEEKKDPQPTQDNPKVNGNPEWGTTPGAKGHFKLAKFCGHMEAKRKSAKPAGPAGAM